MLLTGQPGIGKSTLLRNFIKNYQGNKLGFVTSEIKVGDERIGFEVETSDGRLIQVASVIQQEDCIGKVSKYYVGSYEFSLLISKLLYEDLDNKLLYIDEIGPIQLMFPLFEELVNKFLASNNMFIGTVKELNVHPFIEQVKKRALVVEITATNRNIISCTPLPNR
jgi:nucleoside-triphosphatase